MRISPLAPLSRWWPRQTVDARVPPAAGGTGTDSPPPLPGLAELRGAAAWRPGQPGPSGLQANQRITATYHALDQAMAAYLGEPTVPNWMTFGKYASRQAGDQIVRLEESLRATQGLHPDAALDAAQDFLAHRRQLGELGIGLWRASGNPVAFRRNMQLLRDALVKGNTRVYADIGPAWTRFLEVERAGGDGVAALLAMGYGQPPRDPQGLILPAFVLYQRAARERGSLSVEARQALVHEANMRIVTHEQWSVVQAADIFGDVRIARLLDGLADGLTVEDARGAFPLLPRGGRWTDFETRMGFERVAADTPGAYRLVDPQGGVFHVRARPDPVDRPGTITTYFEDGLGREAASTLVGSRPAPLPAAYDDGNDVLNWFSSLGRGLREAWARLWGRQAAA